MKFISLFTKTPQHKKFTYAPRFYDPRQEERKIRNERIQAELLTTEKKEIEVVDTGYRSRIAGSFKTSKKSSTRQSDPSASMMRLIILTFLALWLYAFIQFGNVAFYGLLLLVPFYFFLKFRNTGRNRSK